MDYTTLGRTGLRVSRMGLGCGGHSRLGLSQDKGEDNAIRVVRSALDMGINFIDTAEAYRTEEVVGKALSGVDRNAFVISTKAGVHWQERNSTPDETRMRVEACLGRLGVDYIDIFHLHGVPPEDYAYARDVMLPVLLDLKAEGKIGFIGITEQFGNDTSHRMLKMALADDLWDVVMIGFNILNQSARQPILAETQEKNVGTLDMFAVRRALSVPETLRTVVAKLVEKGEIDSRLVDSQAPLGFLTSEGHARSVTEAAYRFCRWEPGMDVVLSGTGSAEHLRENFEALQAPPLPEAVTERLRNIFAGVDSVSGN